MAYIPSSVRAAQEAAKKQQKLWEEEQKKNSSTAAQAGIKTGAYAGLPKTTPIYGAGYVPTAVQAAQEAAKRQQEKTAPTAAQEVEQARKEQIDIKKSTTPAQSTSSSSTPIYEAGYVPTAVQAAQEAANKYQDYVASQQSSTKPTASQVSSAPAPSTPEVTSQPPAKVTSQPPAKVTSQPPASVGTGEIPDYWENIPTPDTSHVVAETNLPREDDPPTSVDTGPSEAEIIRQMIEDAKKARIASMLASLDKMYEAQLEAIAEEEAGVRPRYYDERNRIQGQSDVNALNFAQYMAGRGIQGSAGGMNELYRNAALQGELGRLSRQEQAMYDSLARDRARLKNAYESDKVLAASDIEAQGLQSLINQMNADRAFGLQEAALTGSYKGQPTFEKMNADRAFALREAGLTGSYKGQPTFEKVKWQADEAYRAKSFDEMVRQFDAKYGLDLRQANLNEAKQAIENAYRQGQISYLQKQKDLLDAEIAYKQKQTELLGSESGGEALKPGDYKTNPDFAADYAKVLADPETTYAILMSEEGAAAFIQKYGIDGYNELLRLARGY